MYLSGGHLCFYRSTFGLSKNFKIAWTDVVQLVQKGSDKILFLYKKKTDWKEEQDDISFSGFSNRDQTYKYIFKLWKSAKGEESESEVD